VTAVAFVVAVVAALAGALCVAADGALQGTDGEPPPPPGGALPPAGAAPGRREQSHRALSFARLVAHLVAAAAAGVGLRIYARPMPEALALGAALVVTLVLVADALPRAIGEAAGRPMLRRLRPVVRAVEFVLGPVVRIATRLHAGFDRSFPTGERTTAERESSTERFRQVVETTAEVAGDQRAILHGVFSLGETEVQEVMVPRIDIVGIEQATPWSDVVARVRSAEHARLPVYDETIDHITGILYAKDLLRYVIEDAPPPAGWLSLVRPALFIPEGKMIDAQLRDFKATRAHIAIVVDEYGGTAGLVTIEDILEEIVGEIRDEHDREELPILAEEGRRFWVSGRVSLDDLSDALGQRFEQEDVATVGGLVFTLLGRVPRAGEELTLNGFRVVVERVVRRRIGRVYFERLEALAESA
jgi:CBS domain containing-hemolysin-like protein